MRFLVDECTGPRVARWLQDAGHVVFSVYEKNRGMDDDSILRLAHREGYIIITNDKDFGKLVFHNQEKHKGIILLRLSDEKPANKIAVLKRVLDSCAGMLENRFTVATGNTIRIT